MAFPARALHAVTTRAQPGSALALVDGRPDSDASVQRFLGGFRGLVEFSGKTVLDLACRSGGVCIEAAGRGATHVVGLDPYIEFAADRVAARAPEFAHRIELLRSDGGLDGVAGRAFDVVMSRDSFAQQQHIDDHMHAIVALLAPGGSLYVGFDPPDAPTLQRFRRIAGASGLSCLYSATNVSGGRAMDLASRIPAVRDHLAQSVYAILRKPAPAH